MSGQASQSGHLGRSALALGAGVLMFGFILFPIYFLVVSSLRPADLLFSSPPGILPNRLSLHFYEVAAAEAPILLWTQNSLIVDQFREMRTPGIIIAPVSRTYRDRLRRDDVAVVEIDRRMASIPTDAVLLDNNAGAMLGTAHLIALGHRRIGVLSGERHWTTGRERVAGYKRALREAGVAVDPALIAHSTFHPVEADAATRDLLARVDDLTAIFAMNNVLALGAVRALRSSAAAFGQISVVAFDDLPWMDLVDPPLTTVAQPTRSMGRRAAELLFCRLEGDRSPPTTLRLPPELVIRGSTRGPRLDESRKRLAG